MIYTSILIANFKLSYVQQISHFLFRELHPQINIVPPRWSRRRRSEARYGVHIHNLLPSGTRHSHRDRDIEGSGP